MTVHPDYQHPVDSTGITMGAGIPDAGLDRLIAATIPAIDDDPTPSADNFIAALAEADQHTKCVVEDIEDAFEVMPADIGIGVGLDLVNAVSHIRTAQRLITHAADALAVK